MQIEEDIEVQCPFCFETISVRIDTSAGQQQEFIYDCEVCCRPIEMRASCVPGEPARLSCSRE